MGKKREVLWIYKKTTITIAQKQTKDYENNLKKSYIIRKKNKNINNLENLFLWHLVMGQTSCEAGDKRQAFS